MSKKYLIRWKKKGWALRRGSDTDNTDTRFGKIVGDFGKRPTILNRVYGTCVLLEYA